MAKQVPQKNAYSGNEKRSVWANRHFRTFFGWFLTIVIALGLAGIFSLCFCSSVIIEDSSMTPAAQIGDRVLINRIAYHVGSVKRGDLIAYRSASDENDIHVKRVVGLPGEEIQIRDGIILINGETYLEPQEFPVMINAGTAADPVRLGSSEYFVLGDDRNNSEDSRFADVGAIPENRILGKTWLIISPADHFGLLR